MEYLDSGKNPIREGLYRDIEDRFYILYLFREGEKWRFQTPDASGEYDFPLNFFRDLVPINDPVKEVRHFRDLNKNVAASFIEKKIDEEIEDRRRLM